MMLTEWIRSRPTDAGLQAQAVGDDMDNCKKSEKRKQILEQFIEEGYDIARKWHLCKVLLIRI